MHLILNRRHWQASGVRGKSTINGWVANRKCRCNVYASYQRNTGPKIDVISWSSNQELAEQCVETISSAMQTDPSTSYYTRPGCEKQFYRAVVRLLLRSYPRSPQLVSLDDGKCAAICYAIPQLFPSFWPALISKDTIDLLFSLKPSVLRAWWGAADFFEDKRAAFVQEYGGTALYLVVIATQPGSQGQGLGSKALQALTRVADRQQVPMYLEASTTRSVSLYERHGFRILNTASWRPGTPSLTFMWRPPVPMSDASASYDSQQEQEGRLGQTDVTTSVTKT